MHVLILGKHHPICNRSLRIHSYTIVWFSATWRTRAKPSKPSPLWFLPWRPHYLGSLCMVESCRAETTPRRVPRSEPNVDIHRCRLPCKPNAQPDSWGWLVGLVTSPSLCHPQWRGLHWMTCCTTEAANSPHIRQHPSL